MRLISLCTIFSVAIATVAAQEIIAVEEWFESMKINRGLVTRNLHGRQRHSRRRGNIIIKRSLVENINLDSSSSSSSASSISSPALIRLEKRVKGFPPRSEIQQRANYFNSFRADSLVNAPVVLKVVQDTPATIKPSSLHKKSKPIQKAVLTIEKLKLLKKQRNNNNNNNKKSKAKKIAKRHLNQQAKKIRIKKQQQNHQKNHQKMKK
ncbi:hypothetical protein BGZ76_000832 [Entomortierella beljakovae]|nr:hypothetical protein BGZ76_000832 [Entomortierella beljakovae]